MDAGWQLLTCMPNNKYCTCAMYSLMHFSFKFNFVSLPDESSRMLLKRRILFFGLTDADMRETENVKGCLTSRYSVPCRYGTIRGA